MEKKLAVEVVRNGRRGGEGGRRETGVTKTNVGGTLVF